MKFCAFILPSDTDMMYGRLNFRSQFRSEGNERNLERSYKRSNEKEREVNHSEGKKEWPETRQNRPEHSKRVYKHTQLFEAWKCQQS